MCSIGSQPSWLTRISIPAQDSASSEAKAATRREADTLARVAEDEDWGGEVQVYADQKEIDMAVGAGRQGYGLVSVWWD